MLIICTQSATVLESENCKIVDDCFLSEEQLEPLWFGSDSEIIQLATVHGKLINSIK
jgi:hypothetical protein